MAIQIKNSFFKGINLDLDYLRIGPDICTWIKGCTLNVNLNGGSSIGQGSNEAVLTPDEGTTALSVTLASGLNYCIGFYSSEQTNEGYFFVYNSNNNHSIWVISGDTGTVTKVYQGNLLNFQLTPINYMAEGRCVVWVEKYTDPITLLPDNYKFIIFTDNYNNQYLIEQKSSIATDSYTTTYFTDTAAFYNPLELITLGVPTPLSTIGLNTPTAYVPTEEDLQQQNLIVRSGWQFRVKFVDIFGRESEHGIISNAYITVVGGGCITASNGLPRCLILNFDAGNPLVNQIVVEYRKWVGNQPVNGLQSGWLEYDTFYKYDTTLGAYWWDREYNPQFSLPGSGITFDLGTNTIGYTFCADKAQNPVDPTETSRTEPGIPRISSSVGIVDTSLALANNVRGFDPIDPVMINKVEFKAIPPTQAPCPPAPTRTITFYACIFNVHFGSFQHYDTDGAATPLYSFGAGSGGDGSTFFGDQDNPGFIAYIAGTPYNCVGIQGSFDVSTGIFTPVPISTSPVFTHIPVIQFTLVDVPASKGIIRLSSHLSKVSDGDYQQTSTYVAGLTSLSHLSSIPSMIGSTGFAANPLKEFEFDCSSGDVNLNGSGDNMFVILDNNGGGSKLAGYLCEQVGTNQPLEMVPVYLSARSGGGTPGDAYGSFFTDHNGFFFVFNSIVVGPAVASFFMDTCDGTGIRVRGVYGSTGTVIPNLTSSWSGMTYGDGTGTYTGPGGTRFVRGNWRNKVYIYPATETFPVSGRITTTIEVTTCADHTIGVPGIPAIMTKVTAGLTNTSGVATFVSHNRYNYSTVFTGLTLPFMGSYVPNYATSPLNQEKIVIGQKGSCEWTNCSGCTYTMADVVVFYFACTGGPRVNTGPNLHVNLTGVGLTGLQSGGKYPVAFWAFDVLGRHTSPQIRTGELGFVNVPNLNDAGYQQFALCQMRVDILTGFVLPTTFTKIAYLIGANVRFQDYISWNADWVQFVDNTGATNTTNPTSIRIYYGSLIEYNKQFNFKTNTGWQPITSGTPDQAPVEGDIIQFIMNGAGGGTWLPSVISAPITYDKNGLFFTLDYLPELATVTNGSLFRIIRPNANQSGENTPLYEQCIVVDLVNGSPLSNITPPAWVSGTAYKVGDLVSNSGSNFVCEADVTSTTPPGADRAHWEAILSSYVLPYYDSYLLQRLIPVPIMKGQPGAIAPGVAPVNPIEYTSTNQDTTLTTGGYSTNNNNNNNGVIIFQPVDAATSFPFYFESPSPADTWGSHVRCWGRVGFVNNYARQVRNSTEIAVSAAYGDRSNFNGLSYFESKNIETFNRNVYGDITVILVETGEILAICNSDYFTTRYNQTQLITNPGGLISSQNQNGIFTAPVTKVGENFGCIPMFVNSIQRYKGIVYWLDAKYGLVRYDFSKAIDVSKEMGYNGYILSKVSILNQKNLDTGANGMYYPVGGIDPKTMEYFLTFWHLPPRFGSASYLNLTSAVSIGVNETIVLDLMNGMLKGFRAFTPEYYGRIPGYVYQKQFISFRLGTPYTHHTGAGITPPLYANYYGTQTTPRVTAVFNLGPEKVKRFLWIEIYTRQTVAATPNQPLMYCDIITSEKGQSSRLLTGQWKLVDGYQTACFLCDLNTPTDPNLIPQTTTDVLFDGNPLQGRWIQVSFIPQSGWSGTYYEVSSVCVYVNGIAPSDGNSKA